MPETLAAEPPPKALNPALLALKPRQVLVSRAAMEKESKTLTSKSEQKVLLLRSIAQYLERCGFSKCFKKFLSEAEIEKKELNSTLPDLEEMYCEFLKKSHLEAVELKDESGDDEKADGKKKAGNLDESDDHETDKKDQKKEAAVAGIAEVNAVEGVEKVKKEKKKKKKEPQLEVTEEEKVKETDPETKHELKEKKKKKKEPKLEVTEEEKVKETDPETKDELKEKKKKKKNKSKSGEAVSLGDDDADKVSKKRKRSEAEETKEQAEDDEESKRRKKEENVEESNEGVQETPVKKTDDQENGNDVEKSGTKSTNQKSGKGLSNSKEPKIPFQRVKVEDVVFTDERLKDNSYWAKDGADSGYGAKAQEVLGQVKGRGFRHEKTKKKRGSYRGGEIDLQSHSVKFNYSDEE